MSRALYDNCTHADHGKEWVGCRGCIAISEGKTEILKKVWYCPECKEPIITHEEPAVFGIVERIPNSYICDDCVKRRKHGRHIVGLICGSIEPLFAAFVPRRLRDHLVGAAKSWAGER
jgi:hypothetical protein